jgi:hypothetical protein
MRENKTIFDHVANIMVTFGVSVVVLLFFCGVFGDDAKEMSSMFQLGSKGLAIETLLQYLGISVVIEVIRSFYFSDKFIKNASNTLRSGGMVLTIIVAVVLFIIAFDWFPVNKGLPWVMFFISFFICFSIGVWVSSIQEKLENKQMEEGLERLKRELEKKR